jgi:hypothetical protein
LKKPKSGLTPEYSGFPEIRPLFQEMIIPSSLSESRGWGWGGGQWGNGREGDYEIRINRLQDEGGRRRGSG